jgi:hypothetical protein
MAVMEAAATVHNGSLVFAKPLRLPEGAEVRVQIEPLSSERAPVGAGSTDYTSQPFFGLWQDRPEMSDSVAWVRGEREKWQQRLASRD